MNINKIAIGAAGIGAIVIGKVLPIAGGYAIGHAFPFAVVATLVGWGAYKLIRKLPTWAQPARWVCITAASLQALRIAADFLIDAPGMVQELVYSVAYPVAAVMGYIFIGPIVVGFILWMVQLFINGCRRMIATGF